MGLLEQWGYPYVFEEFRFHMTLTGKLDKEMCKRTKQVISQHLPDLPSPYIIDRISLVGERDDGMFECIHHYPLKG
jgi:hypothetical protein